MAVHPLNQSQDGLGDNYAYPRQQTLPDCCYTLASTLENLPSITTNYQFHIDTRWNKSLQRHYKPGMADWFADNPLQVGDEIHGVTLPRGTALHGVSWTLYHATPGLVLDIGIKNLETDEIQIVFADWNLGAELVDPADSCSPGADAYTCHHFGFNNDNGAWGDSDCDPKSGFFQKANHELILIVKSVPTPVDPACTSCCPVPEMSFRVRPLHVNVCNECGEEDWFICCP